jgi:hypothetical protein
MAGASFLPIGVRVFLRCCRAIKAAINAQRQRMVAGPRRHLRSKSVNFSGITAGFEFTVMERVELAEPFAVRVTCAGLKVQVSGDTVLHLSVTCPLNPPEELT